MLTKLEKLLIGVILLSHISIALGAYCFYSKADFDLLMTSVGAWAISLVLFAAALTTHFLRTGRHRIIAKDD